MKRMMRREPRGCEGKGVEGLRGGGGGGGGGRKRRREKQRESL